METEWSRVGTTRREKRVFYVHDLMNHPLVWIIIGVAGCGKTTIGRLLADRLDCDFLEGDRRHPVTNVRKMSAGLALTDGDRAAWLDDLAGEAARAAAAGREMVMSCSALRRSYRTQLSSVGRVQMVLPLVPAEVLLARLDSRQGHYMSKEMLESQIRAFETPSADEGVWEVDGMLHSDAVVTQITERRQQTWPELRQVWWRRL